MRETHLVEAITGEPEETSGENYGHDKSDFLYESFMQVAAHEVSERSRDYLEKKHVSKVCSVIWNLSMNLITIQEVPLLSPVEMHTSIIKRSSTSYSLVSIEPCPLYNFRYMQNTSKSNQEGNNEFEAWMLVAGEKREGFNYSLFFEQFPDAQQHIFRIREIVNIQVMREFDIV